MMREVLLILAISVTNFLIFSKCTPEETEYNKIVGGQIAAPTQFPYIVSLRDWFGNHHCGGVIVHEFWVLTTALCIHGANRDYFIIVAGSNILEHGGTPYRIAQISAHPNFSVKKTENDIALLMVTSPFRLNKFVQVASMDKSFIGANVSAAIVGWGSVSKPGYAFSNELKYLNVTTIDAKTCQKQHSPEPIYNNSQICTTAKDSGACHGDAGGPLVANDKLIGLVSWGKPCAINLADVHTRLSNYSEWIVKKITVVKQYYRIHYKVGLKKTSDEFDAIAPVEDTKKVS